MWYSKLIIIFLRINNNLILISDLLYYLHIIMSYSVKIVFAKFLPFFCVLLVTTTLVMKNWKKKKIFVLTFKLFQIIVADGISAINLSE